MQIGLYGLGRMGGSMARRLARGGHPPVVWNIEPAPIRAVEADGAVGASSLEDLVKRLTPPRTVWVMIPAGEPTETAVEELGRLLAPGDAIVDGGNSHFKDDVRRARRLASKGVHYLDVGTSGGVWGLERGYCLMIGGPREAVARLEPIFRALAPGRSGIEPVGGKRSAGQGRGEPSSSPSPPRSGGEGRGEGDAPRAPGTAADGFLHCGPSGAGHFVKMIHNGIEYGLMQAYAEGFDIMRNAGCPGLPEGERYDLDLGAVAELWRRGSVVSSWLLDLAAGALAEDPKLEGYAGSVADSGEGRWTIEAAIAEAVPADVLAAALFTRFRSRQEHTFAEKLLSALRRGFGGHAEAPVAKGGKK
jgi:6-phosphogluconate dehydrogenase